MADAVHRAASSTRSFRLSRVRSASCNMFARRRTIVLSGHDCLHQKRAVISRVQDLFVDEIHHFNKAQQDILLPDVEAGNLRLIGATTYNPFFYVNSALVSRSQVFRLEPLSVEQLEQLIDRALADKERGLGNYNAKIDRDARRHLAKLSDGDARKCLNALEIGVLTTPPVDAAPPPRLHYFDSSAPMGRLRGGNLPHWRQDGAMYFVTWRTADSMPRERVDQWMEQRDAWLKAHPEPWSMHEEQEYYRLFPDRW